MAGCYAIESLTHQIERESRKYIDRIDELGGAVSAIEQGFIQREIQNSAYQYQLDIEQKRRIVVGQNDFQCDETETIPLLKINPKEEQEQCQRLKKFREIRNEAVWAQCLRNIELAARGNENLVPLILDAVKAGATVGEISDSLRSVWGEYSETVTI